MVFMSKKSVQKQRKNDMFCVIFLFVSEKSSNFA